MPSRYKSRLRKLEKPVKQIPIMNFIYTDGKTDPDAALEHLGMKREPGELVICLGLLDRDEEPRLVTDTSVEDSLTRSAEGPKNEWGYITEDDCPYVPDDDDPDESEIISN